jgi:hypothetical protein
MKSIKSELSKAEKLLVAAGRLAAEGHDVFTTEDLVVSAYKAFPDYFCLRGHPEYPDSNMILTQLMGRKAPLLTKGWLEKSGTKKFRLTPKGLTDFKEIEHSESIEAFAYLDRRRAEQIGALLLSPAFELASAGEVDTVTFHQFCRFVGLVAGDPWQTVEGKLEKARHLVAEAQKLGEAGQGLRPFIRGKTVAFEPEDLRSLGAILAALENRFTPQMQAWKKEANRH